MGKKIGIITFHSAHNYGAMLQAYALQHKLEENNTVEIINYRNNTIDNEYKVIKINHSGLKNTIKSIISNIVYFPRNVKRYKKFNKFMNESLKLTKKYNSEKQLKEDFPKHDIYITGSDQVWNIEITNGLQDSYTLNFGNDNIKRISYAASIGNDKVSSVDKKIYKEKLKNIDYISVREENAKKILEEEIEKEIEVVLDPTLLLEQKEWENGLKTLKNEKEKYILAYVVSRDEEFIKIVNKLSEKTNLKVIHFSKKDDGIKNVLRRAYTEGPYEFINLIKNAEYVVCTSFHATVFSIIFNKKFIVIPHRKTGTRVTNLLKKLGLSNRAVSTLKEFEKTNYDEEMNYKEVHQKLEVLRKKSIEWLEAAIGK